MKTPVLEFRILGPLEVLEDGAALPLGGQKQRALLAVLLLRRGDVVSIDRLVEELWGESPPRTATTSLQNFVSQLRKLLGPEIVETRPPGYRLRIEPGQFDLARFERLVREARSSDATARAQLLREALALWRGPPLGDFAYEPFAQGEILRLEELRLAAIQDRLDADLELGGSAELVGELESLVREHPLRERLRGQLMLALYRSGRQADALNAYHDARHALVGELGIEPSPSLQQLHSSILRQEAGLEALTAEAAPDHLRDVTAALLTGRLVPLLGSDVVELSTHLADRFAYPRGNGLELTRVSQYVAVMKGSGPLYDELHELFAARAEPNPVHRFLASLPALLRERGLPHQLIVSTAYDVALEQAFLEAGEELDIVSYVAAGRHRGKFCHVRPDGSVSLIDVPNTYATELSLERRTIILKIHGRVDPSPAREWESFVVTEDDYIDYLAQSDVATVIPVAVAATLLRSHFLFLGYRMSDWNLRVILNRLWGEQSVRYRSWAVQAQPSPVERAFWQQRDVQVVDAELDEYVEALRPSLQAATTAGASA